MSDHITTTDCALDLFRKYLERFPHYSPSVFEKVRPLLSRRKIQAGEYWLPLDKVCRNIAFIEKGLVRLYYLNDGKEVTHCFCRENEITTSYSSLIAQQASEIAIQAIEDCELIELSYASLQQLYDTDLFWQQVGRLSAESEIIRTEGHHRFIRDLSATDRYLQVLEQDETLLQRVPLNYLATYLQVSPETLSRIRKKVSRT